MSRRFTVSALVLTSLVCLVPADLLAGPRRPPQRNRTKEAQATAHIGQAKPSCLSEEQRLAVIEKARAQIFAAASRFGWTSRELDLVRTTNPWMAFDCPDDPDAEYVIWWNEGGLCFAQIEGKGSILNLEHASVTGYTGARQDRGDADLSDRPRDSESGREPKAAQPGATDNPDDAQ